MQNQSKTSTLYASLAPVDWAKEQVDSGKKYVQSGQNQTVTSITKKVFPNDPKVVQESIRNGSIKGAVMGGVFGSAGGPAGSFGGAFVGGHAGAISGSVTGLVRLKIGEGYGQIKPF